MNNVLLTILYSASSGAPSIPTDPDALIYIAAVEAAGVTVTDTQKNKLHHFFGLLKTNAIYYRLKAMYIPVWGSAVANKFNALNPVDSDAAFRLTFPFGATHSVGGLGWDGASQYAFTHLIPNDHYTGATGSSMGYCSITDSVQGDVYEMGAYIGPSQSHFISIKNGSYTPGKPFISQYSAALVEYPITDSRGLYIINRPPVGEEQGPVMWRNGIVIADSMSTVLAEPKPTCAVTLGALNVNGTMYGYSNRGTNFVYQGYSLTSVQITALNNAVSELLTSFI